MKSATFKFNLLVFNIVRSRMTSSTYSLGKQIRVQACGLHRVGVDCGETGRSEAVNGHDAVTEDCGGGERMGKGGIEKIRYGDLCVEAFVGAYEANK
jgi:hypothetical protein